MKKLLSIITIFTILLSGCVEQQSMFDRQLDEAERIIKESPDSASNILKSIPSPEKLDDRTFARWCMLSGKITDEIFNSLLPSFQFERAYDWYSMNGKPDEQVQILVYLGRANAAEGDFDKAMSIYTNALEIAQKTHLNNLTGYTYCYIGDLYRENFMFTESIKKYESAAKYFKQANNIESYACALRDIGREYVYIDSIPRALEILTIADSIVVNSQNIEVVASINNALGNIYAMQGKYDKAEKHLLKALVGREKMPDYIALIDLYTASDSIDKAKKLLYKIPKDDKEYISSIKYLYYQIYNTEKNYKDALASLEEYVDMVDSIVYADGRSKILDIEAKYNHLKTSQEINKLKIKQQGYIIISVISIAALLLIIILYLLYRKRTKDKIQRQQNELSLIKIEFLHLSLELEKKKSLLDTYKEKDENYDKMMKEITLLSTNYKKLQNKLLIDSPIYKKLVLLANQNKPGSGKSLITEKEWKLITTEIKHIYPDLYNYIYKLCPNLQEQDFKYCCLYMYGFDTNAEAKLLNIAIESVRTKRLRLRQKLNITLPDNKTSLHQYLLENMN